jgi:hypothetical protein
MEHGMMDTTITSCLLSVEHQRNKGYRTTRLYPASAAIFNLFFCAYFERFVKSDFTGYYLSLFLLFEGSLYAFVSTSSFFTVGHEILSKSRVFPTTSTSRLVFVLTSNVRRPIVWALVGSNVFFLLIILRHALPHALIAPLVFILMILTIEVVLSTSLLVLLRRSVPTGSVIALLAFSIFALFVGTTVFHADSLLRTAPIVGWATNGILASSTGNIATALVNACWLALLILGGFVLGRRLA